MLECTHHIRCGLQGPGYGDACVSIGERIGHTYAVAGGVVSRRTWTDSCDTTISLVLLCDSGMGIGNRVLTGWDVKSASNVVQYVD